MFSIKNFQVPQTFLPLPPRQIFSQQSGYLWNASHFSTLHILSFTFQERSLLLWTEQEVQETALLRIWPPFSSLSLFKLPPSPPPPFPLSFPLLFLSAKFCLGDFQCRTPWSSSSGATTAHVCCYLSERVKAKNFRPILGGDGGKLEITFFSALSPFLLLIP